MQIKLQNNVYKNFEELQNIREQWDNFIESIGCEIFLTYDWCRIWWKHYGQAKPLRIFVFKDADKIVGILPTYIDNISIGPLCIKAARIVSSTFVPAEFSPPISNEFLKPVYKAWLEHLFLEFNPEIICFGPLAGTFNKTLEFITEFSDMNDSRYMLEKKENGVQTIYPLGISFNEYLEKLSKTEKREMNRHCRNIIKVVNDNTAEIITETVCDTGLAKAFDDFVQMHMSHWQNEGQGGHFNDWPKSEIFHREMAEAQLKNGRLRLFKMKVGDVCTGYEYGYKFSDTYFAYLNSRTQAEEFQRISVGRVHFCELIKKAIGEDVKLINSMRGKYEYKLRMGGKLVPIYSIHMLRRGAFVRMRISIFKLMARLINCVYYKIWFSRLAPKLPFQRKPLWEIWIKTNVFAH